MAKGNLFLGTAARSVGDVVMYRREGSQVSRVRVRKIANPKTDAQCEQRAFMSAVVKFYQPLANVLDRSWQGLSRAKSYAKFLKTNAGIVRQQGLYIPKDRGFVALPLKLSNGTLPAVTVIEQAESVVILADEKWDNSWDATKIADISSFFIKLGFKNGDVITFIKASASLDSENNVDAAQIVIDTNAGTATVESLYPGLSFTYNQTMDALMFFVAGGGDDAGAVIVSRNVDGVWQRSNSYMVVTGGYIASMKTAANKAATIASYKGAAASDNPLVYLDGDELDNA